MAGKAVFRQDGTDAHLEEFPLVGDGGRAQSGGQQKQRQRK